MRHKTQWHTWQKVTHNDTWHKVTQGTLHNVTQDTMSLDKISLDTMSLYKMSLGLDTIAHMLAIMECIPFSLVIQWTLEIVDLDIVDSLVLVDKIVLTIYDFMK